MGYWGKNLVRNFYQLECLKTVCDANPDIEKDIKDKFPDTNFTTDYRAVLSDDTIKAVAISTPAATHYQLAKEALLAGKDVFVEKPLALELKQGEELIRLSAERKLVLMVGHILQYHPAVIKLKSLIQSEAMGQIQYIYSNRLNIGKIRTEENILWSFAPHDISVILSLLQEEPCDVNCQGSDVINKNVADMTISEFLFPSGVRAHIFVSWWHPFKEQLLVVMGSEKMAVFDDTSQDKLKLYPHRVENVKGLPVAVKAEAEIVPLPSDEPLRSECKHFLSCVAERKKPLTDGEEGLRVLRVLNECQKALESQSAIIKPAEKKPYFAHPTAVIDEPCEIGEGTKIWHFSHVMKGAKIGKKCIFGQNCNIDGGTIIGNNVKAQNNISIYTGVVIEDDVFLGPSCVLTNVTNPRSQVLRHSLYETTVLKRGCSIGANATIVCGITIGRYAFIGAGAVVPKDVPDYALMMGVPARQVGWISRHGHRLHKSNAEGIYTCPESGFRYKEVSPGVLKCLDLDEDSVLPPDKALGKITYDEFKKKL
jgi:UDP-2-acetamido-3-amino-2,3-dideoxy-glucuronate N-acetyltransferase